MTSPSKRGSCIAWTSAVTTFPRPRQGQGHQEDEQGPHSQLSPPGTSWKPAWQRPQKVPASRVNLWSYTSGWPLARQSNTGTRSMFFPASPVASSCLHGKGHGVIQNKEKKQSLQIKSHLVSLPRAGCTFSRTCNLSVLNEREPNSELNCSMFICNVKGWFVIVGSLDIWSFPPWHLSL